MIPCCASPRFGMPNAWAALALLSGAGRTNRNMIVEELYDALIEAGASEEVWTRSAKISTDITYYR